MCRGESEKRRPDGEVKALASPARSAAGEQVTGRTEPPEVCSTARREAPWASRWSLGRVTVPAGASERPLHAGREGRRLLARSALHPQTRGQSRTAGIDGARRPRGRGSGRGRPGEQPAARARGGTSSRRRRTERARGAHRGCGTLDGRERRHAREEPLAPGVAQTSATTAARRTARGGLGTAPQPGIPQHEEVRADLGGSAAAEGAGTTRGEDWGKAGT